MNRHPSETREETPVDYDNITCFRCQQPGHISAECPTRRSESTRPERAPQGAPGTGEMWCGTCDEDTRLIAVASDQTTMARCPNCHPLRGRQLPQHLRCPRCRVVILNWDQMPCGDHQPIGRLPYVGPQARREFAGGMPEPREFPGLFPGPLEIHPQSTYT